jgi:branched-chain amino acid transport system ATP-binding protein
MLRVEDLKVSYGKAPALDGVSLHVGKAELVSLLGSNGAGKSTLLRTISGTLRPREGRILLDGDPIHTLPSHAIVGRGVVHVPEGREVFRELTVTENLRMGAYLRRDDAGVRRDLDYVFEVFPRLKERRSQAAGTMSGGEAQMLAIARGLLSAPRLLMLDEPSLGIAPLLRDKIFEIIRRIFEERGVAILLVEQNAKAALRMCSRAYVVDNGKIGLEGRGEALLEDPYVKTAYLGY